MKRLAIVTLLSSGLALIAQAAVIQYDGSLDCGGSPRACTHTYLEFAVEKPTLVHVAGILNAGPDLNIFTYPWSGGSEIQGPAVLPRLDLRITQPSGNTAATLNPGNYIVGAIINDSDWDAAEGFVPFFHIEDIGGSGGSVFSLAITGDFAAKNIWQGNLDGTFTVIPIPEPGGVGLLAGASLLFLRRRRCRTPALAGQRS